MALDVEFKLILPLLEKFTDANAAPLAPILLAKISEVLLAIVTYPWLFAEVLMILGIVVVPLLARSITKEVFAPIKLVYPRFV